MDQVKLRFYGRFVYAEAVREGSGAPDRISVVAPNFDRQLFGRHQTLMTVQRGQLLYGEATTLEPSTRMASHAPIHDAELLIWDLSGYRVGYGVTASPVRLAPAHGDILELPALESLRGRVAALDPVALVPDPDGVSNTVIELTAGEGVATPVLHDARVLLSSAADAQDDIRLAQQNAARDPETDEAVEATPADLVEFMVTLPEGQRALTLTFSKTGAAPKRVTVRAGGTVVFTNLCAQLHAPRKFDLEFSQYYSVLRQAPGADALIPIEPPAVAMAPGALGEGIDCDIQARIQYDPSRQ